MQRAFMDDIAQLTDLLHIPYPADIEPVFASLPGPAFFPGGSGLLPAQPDRRTLPRRGVMVLGHNFGTVPYYAGLQGTGGENLQVGTWVALLGFLAACGIATEECFFTNALMGLMRKQGNVGTVAGFEDKTYRLKCKDILHASLLLQRPRVLLVLGKPTIRFVGEALSGLAFWKGCAEGKSMQFIDAEDPDGPLRHGVALPGCNDTMSVVALVHPSYRRLNAARRTFQGQTGADCERTMVLEALRVSGAVPA
jgi:hypothetical protein